jgi:predicted DNA-binding protein
MSAQQETTNAKVLRVHLTPEDYERLRQLAKAEFRSAPQHVRFLIHQDIERGEKSWSQ